MSEGATANHRRYRRQEVFRSGTLHSGGTTIDCIVKDISASGAQLMTHAPVRGRSQFVVDLDQVGLFPGHVVWLRDQHVGLQFVQEPTTVSRRIRAVWGLDIGSP